MSAEHRFAIGAGLLVGPLLAASIAFLVDWAYQGGPTPPGRQRPQHRKKLAASACVAGSALVFALLQPPSLTFVVVEIVAVAAVVPATLYFLERSNWGLHTFEERLTVFASVLVAAGFGAIVAEGISSRSTFDDAEIVLEGASPPVTGGYLTSTEHAIVLTPSCEVVEAIPRARIASIKIGPGQVTRDRC
jgi:hypothetical protein